MTAAMAEAPGDLVGVREAARRIGVNASTISRQVAKGVIPNRGTPEHPLIDVDEARRSRATNLDLSKQRGEGATLYSDSPGGDSAARDFGVEHGDAKAPFPAAPRQAGAAPPSTADRPGGDASPEAHLDDAGGARAAPAQKGNDSRFKFNTAATAHKALQAQLSALDLKERQGELVAKASVEGEYETLARGMADRVANALRSIAGRLATMTDEREIAQLLRQTHDDALNTMSAEIAAGLE